MPETDETPDASNTSGTVEAAITIADWCETRANECTSLASRQIIVVWWLLLAGLVLLLLLPRVIQEIDFAWRKDSLPPAVMANAEKTRSSIEENKLEMEREAEEAAARLARLTQVEKDLRADFETDRDNLRKRALAPRALFATSASAQFPVGTRILDMESTRNEVFVVAITPDNARPGEPVLFTTADGIRWSQSRLPIPAQDLGGDGLAMTRTAEGDVLLSPRGQRPNIYRLEADGLAQVYPPEDQPAFSGRIDQLYTASDGAVYGVGSLGGSRERRQLLVVSRDNGATWGGVTGSPLPGLTSGGFFAVIERDGQVEIGGYAQGAEGAIRPALLRGSEGGAWTTKYFSDLEFDAGSVASFVHAADGAAYALVGRTSNNLMLRSDAPGTWDRMEVSGVRPMEFWQGPGDSVLGFFETPTRGGPEFWFGSPNPEGRMTRFSDVTPGEFDASLYGAVRLPEGRMMFVTSTAVFLPLDEPEAAAYFDARIESSQRPGTPAWMQIVTSRNLENRFDTLARAGRDLDAATAEREQQAQFVATTKASFKRQSDALDEFGSLTGTLEQSLRQSDTTRQLAQIATRLAVIGLLIYLVQIVVNRYRYLQRLAGFYQARAQALRLWAVQPGGTLMEGVTVADLTAMLSPDGIGFDKSAEPPTGQMVSLLQAGLRKG
ncbi:hypothetical protein [Vannielia litorea]|uniref:hypothetical protein n=1 Tax=Vannielia litorea TaxID=1217970 RepID=UPI001BCDB853|nr:hypothetical protein [Vannielia litorea]MBS8227395.1 hypothetical protein [Vannielia litorea]